MKSYAKGNSLKPLLRETIGANLKRTTLKFPDTDALISPSEGYRSTYAQFSQQVTDLAKGLLALGVKKGEKVGIWAGNRSEWVLAQFATAKIGAVMVAVNPSYKSSELAYALNLSETKYLLHAAGYKNLDYAEILTTARPSTKNLMECIEFGTKNWQELVNLANETDDKKLDEIEQSLDYQDPINIQFTSGTTGNPKGALLSHYNILNNGYLLGNNLKYTNQDKVCIPVPFYHCFGMVLGNLACTTHGSTMVIPSYEFDPKKSLETVEAERCTSLYGVPTMFYAQLHHPEFKKYDLSSLRTGVLAGSLCPRELMTQVIEKFHMKQVTIGYGMTETSPLSTGTLPDDPIEKRVSTVGAAFPHTEIKVVDPKSREIVERGQIGEFMSRGYLVMKGYYNNPEATKKSIDKDGWMETGDLAFMDEDGYVSIVGRLKDTIIRGGENIHPKEIEEFLIHSGNSGYPGIIEAQVFGIPDEKYGEVVVAWLKVDRKVDLEDVRGYCRANIADFKVPKYFKIVDQFPLTVTGKPQKYIMRQEFVKELENK